MAKAITQEAVAQNGHREGHSIVEQLRERSRLRTEVVKDVPRWGMDATIRELSAKEVSSLQLQTQERKMDPLEITLRLLSVSLVEPALEYEDLVYLCEGSMEPLNYIAEAIRALNRIGEEGLRKTENSFPDSEE